MNHDLGDDKSGKRAPSQPAHTDGASGRGAPKTPSEISVPSYALHTLEVLENAGHEAWVVGGFVRDTLLGRACADIDVATSALWQEAQCALEAAGCRTHETGVKHGTLTAIVDGMPVEVTTYRTDGTYADSRHPTEVRFVRSLKEDLARRDFTMNAIAYHPARGLADPFGGAADLRAGIVRAVGDPLLRFKEDALRILRACRFASQLGFCIEEATYAALLERKSLLRHISAERITHELDALLLGEHVHDALMGTADVLAAVLPELVAMKGFDQRTPYHIYDVLEHTAWVVQRSPATSLSRWAALFHDVGKPAAFFTRADGVGHFYGHQHISEQLARAAFGRLRFSPAFCDKVLTLVRCHDDVIEPAPKAVKRALARLGGDTDLFAALCALKRADALAQAPCCASRAQTADELMRVLDRILAEGAAFSLRDLRVNGRDVLALGVAEGPAVGDVLAAALDAVIDERTENEPEALRNFMRSWAGERGLTDE